ncbi:MAG: hypothetical protein V2J62_06430 [candidate division KSB1 bacterium]|jgi:hypothetical protein|nr:hypothetical protein [candidate division KSB1 bacterium]
MKNEQFKTITTLSILLVITLGIASFFGIFVPGTYERETASMAAQGIGQDIVNLFFALPILIISLVFVHRNSKIAWLIFSGTLFYIMYSFVIYGFGVNFNRMFLIYCATLGLSLYALILVMIKLSSMDAGAWFEDKIPHRPIGIYMIVVAGLFYLLWLKDVVPAIITNTTPKSVSDYKLLVNPVHVIDMAFALPGLIISALLLLKKQSMGYILTPIFLVFIILLTIALAGMVIVVKMQGIAEDMSIAAIFLVMAVISSIFLYRFLKHLKS